MRNNSIFVEAAYPYKGKYEKCKNFRTDRKKSVKTFTSLNKDYKKKDGANVNDIKNALEDGPVIAELFADSRLFRSYSSGIIDDALSCSGRQVSNHAVLIVGYGKQDGRVFFVVKNSFGKAWGEEGYARIAASTLSVCGILSRIYI